MNKKWWVLKETVSDETAKSISGCLNDIPLSIAHLLAQREITSFQTAKKFFRPEVTQLNDPFLMDGMEAATNRIITAVTNNEPICIYGDYDVDGTCATAILYMFLREMGADVDYYIPKRLTDGYGISIAGVDFIASKGTKLLVSVDCGITAIEECAYAKTLGMDVIICDHHQPKDKIPEAAAVLDPLKPGCNYPFKHLCGAGVTLKLIQGFCYKVGKDYMPHKYLDLVALASAADIVSLVDENRIIVKAGLEIINKDPRPGIRALIEASRVEQGSLNSGQIVFTLAPRINAVGRLGDAERAVKLLISEDIDEAKRLAAILETENFERRKIDEDTFHAAAGYVENNLDLETDIPIIIHQEDWHPGVIGIVASRLVEKYYRPTIMLTTVDGVAKGSARSISKFNIFDALKQCEDLLLHYGGHKAAAGLSMELGNLELFKTKFNQVTKETVNQADLHPEILIDLKVELADINPKFLRLLEQFAPFGPGNQRPYFLAENVQIANHTMKIVGNNHLSVKFKQNGYLIDAIGFNMGDYFKILSAKNSYIDIVFSIDKLYRDKTSPQLKLKDISIKES